MISSEDIEPEEFHMNPDKREKIVGCILQDPNQEHNYADCIWDQIIDVSDERTLSEVWVDVTSEVADDFDSLHHVHVPISPTTDKRDLSSVDFDQVTRWLKKVGYSPK